MADTPQKLLGGLLVVFEGIDGVGKTTQLELANKELSRQGWPVETTRNLGGTPIGEELRKVIKSPLARPNTTNLYISVAIQEALIGTIDSARAKGKLILMDRGPLSLAAYEIYGAGLEESLGWPHVESGMRRLKPELTIIYTADTKTALQRIQGKSKPVDYFESKSPSFFDRVASGYVLAAKRYASQVVLIDGNQPIDVVHAQTMSAIRQALAKKS